MPCANMPRRMRALLDMALLLAAVTVAVTTARADNGCLPGDFVDWRGRAQVEIGNTDPTNPYRYRPRCTLISEGTVVRFVAVPDFGSHPLYAGRIVNGMPEMDPSSPIGSITSGQVQERRLLAWGEFPFFCDFHYAMGMKGSIRVVPELFADGFDGP